MRWLKCSLLVTALCANYGQSSVTQRESLNAEITRENEINFQGPNSAILEHTENILNDLTLNLTQKSQNLTQANTQTAAKEIHSISKSGEKQENENITLNDIKPFLLFPILPLLFPPREENLKKDIFPNPTNETSKNEKGPSHMKPFILFDFAFNVRRVSINNGTENANDSEINNADKLGNVNDFTPAPPKSKRHAKRKMETSGFFDDFPLFPDSELDEFLPKPDLFFPDLPFHHKSLKKLSRRKRGQTGPKLKNDLKTFSDAFHEVFRQTENELEWADPIFNFLRGGAQFEEEKNQLPEIREKPSLKIRIQKNIKGLNNERQDDLIKAQDSPTIIVDKVVKIGQFHVHDNHKNNKRDGKESKFLGRNNYDEDTYKPTAFKRDESKGKRMNHLPSPNSEGQTYTKMQTEEIKILPKFNASFFSANDEPSGQPKRRDLKKIIAADETAQYENLMETLDSLKTKVSIDVEPSVETLKRKNSAFFEKETSKEVLREELKKNVSELLTQFLTLVKNLDNAKLMGRRGDVVERDHAEIFDWTEKETLQNILGKSSGGNREKKTVYFEEEYPDLSVKERQVTDLNYLFLGVTVPAVLVFTLVLLTCFYSLQIKGKICTKLFKTRQVFLLDNDVTKPFTEKRAKKIQPI